jgi:hypothetical protein
MPVYTNAHGQPIANPTFWDRMTNGSPSLNPLLRGTLAAGIGAIPVVGQPLAAGYNLGRMANSFYRWAVAMGHPNLQLPRTDPDYGSPDYIGLGQPVDPSSAPPPTPSAPPPQAAPQSIDDWRQAIISHLNNTGFNAARPAFGGTSFQYNNPGSAIGPGVFSTTGSGYFPNGTVGSHSGVDTGLPAWAAGVMSDVRAKNII